MGTYLAPRRAVLLSGAALGGAALAGCQGLTAAQAGSQVAADVATIASGLQAALGPLAASAGLPANALTTVANLVGDVVSVANQVSATMSQSSAQPLIQQIESDLNGVVGALAALPPGLVPLPVSMALAAAMVLLPVIEAGVNLVVSQTTVTTAKSLRATVPVWTPDGARAYLKGIGK